MALGQLAYVAAFTRNQPWNDEWEFVPMLCEGGNVPAFLWAQHNEHRMPLPRALYLGLFRLTHDYRAGSVLQVVLVSALAFAAMRWSAAVRGLPSWADLFFPLTLLHVGHYENLLMGYQICFALACLFAGWLLKLALEATPERRLRTASIAAMPMIGLCLCGGFGLVFAFPAAAWMAFLALRKLRGKSAAALGVLLVSCFPILYTFAYFQDYERPPGHPPFEMKNAWIAGQVAAQVIALGFGFAVAKVWFVAFLGVALCGAWVGLTAAIAAWVEPEERPRAAGLFAVAVGALGLAAAIGAGRSGFGPTYGLWARYAILSWPLIAALFFAAVAWPVGALKWIPPAFVIAATVLYPINTGIGISRGGGHVAWLDAIAAMAESRETDEEIVEAHIAGTGQEERALVGIPMLRARRFGPFAP